MAASNTLSVKKSFRLGPGAEIEAYRKFIDLFFNGFIPNADAARNDASGHPHACALIVQMLKSRHDDAAAFAIAADYGAQFVDASKPAMAARIARAMMMSPAGYAQGAALAARAIPGLAGQNRLSTLADLARRAVQDATPVHYEQATGIASQAAKILAPVGHGQGKIHTATEALLNTVLYRLPSPMAEQFINTLFDTFGSKRGYADPLADWAKIITASKKHEFGGQFAEKAFILASRLPDLSTLSVIAGDAIVNEGTRDTGFRLADAATDMLATYDNTDYARALALQALDATQGDDRAVKLARDVAQMLTSEHPAKRALIPALVQKTVETSNASEAACLLAYDCMKTYYPVIDAYGDVAKALACATSDAETRFSVLAKYSAILIDGQDAQGLSNVVRALHAKPGRNDTDTLNLEFAQACLTHAARTLAAKGDFNRCAQSLITAYQTRLSPPKTARPKTFRNPDKSVLAVVFESEADKGGPFIFMPGHKLPESKKPGVVLLGDTIMPAERAERAINHKFGENTAAARARLRILASTAE